MPQPDLREMDLARLRAVFGAFAKVRRVLVFGSRAIGTAKRASDLDLAVEAPGMSESAWSDFRGALDEAPVILEVDVVRLDRLPPGPLAEAIRRDGISIYP